MKLIKINENHYIVVTDEKIEKDDYFYVTTKNISGGNVIKQSKGNGMFAWSNHIISDNTDERGYHPSNVKKITHSTEPLEAPVAINGFKGYNHISLSSVKELLGEVDVESLAEDKTNIRILRHKTPSQIARQYFDGYVNGYNEALQDNKDKKYTEEDIIYIIDNISQNWFKCYSEKDKKEHLLKIAKYLQKTEWEVELVEGKLKLK